MAATDMASYMRRRRHNTRRELVSRLGGECQECGSTDDLVFDHVDPSSKKIEPCFLGDYGEERREAEVEKLQLLCRSCHNSKNHEDAVEFFMSSRRCDCGRFFDNRYAYAGHRGWCNIQG